MLHLYCGEGKGKTSAALGLALRMAGRGGRVLLVQFLKGADSGERFALAHVPGVELLEVPQRVKFSFQLSQREREAEAGRYEAMLTAIEGRLNRGAMDLLILDEICSAVQTSLVPLPRVLGLLDQARPLEVVLTGRNPPEAFCQRADYLTRFENLRHPYDAGVAARRGVEF